MNTVTTVTLVGGVAVIGIGVAAWLHSRSATMVGTAKDQSVVAAQSAATSAGKTGSADVSATTGRSNSKLAGQLQDAQTLFNFGMNAINSARAAAQSPGQ